MSYRRVTENIPVNKPRTYHVPLHHCDVCIHPKSSLHPHLRFSASQRGAFLLKFEFTVFLKATFNRKVGFLTQTVRVNVIIIMS